MRRELYNDKYGLAYGQDHAVGRFIQIWKLDSNFSNHALENQIDDDNVIIDFDELFGKEVTIDFIVKTAKKYGFDIGV